MYMNVGNITDSRYPTNVMATKINRKTPSATSREVVGTEKSTKPEFTAVSATGTGINTTSIGKRIERPTQRRGKASIAIKLRTKAKQTPKIKKKLKNKILQSAKSLENRRKLLKNGLKGNKLPKIRATIKKEKDEMPTLEPILPIVENTEAKKQVKKRTKKIIDERQLLDVKKIKIEEDDDVSLSSDAADVETNIKKQLNKPRGRKKVKNLTETVDDTINDLTFMIKKEDIKTEVDSTSESGKSDISKAKKLTRKQKIELLDYESYDAMDSSIKKEDVKLELDVVPEFGGKSDISKTKKLSKKRNLDLLKKILKKENIENTLDKMDEVDEKLIDVLDLNVGTIKRKVIAKRRHSIEKFPMTPIDGVDITISHLFNHLPRSLSPRSKRHVKARQGSEGLSRKSSPYSTRSDTPARLLRNGKQRKWIDLNLIEGLESDGRKRRRLCSDLSGSEMSVSKLSGYESDSSFSDLASSHGADNNDAELVKSSSFKESFEDTSNEVSTSVKESEDCTKVEMIDTNSNVCNNLNKEELKPENIELSHDDGDSKIKAPEKSIILDIMKQTFNEVVSNKSTTVALESVSNIYVKEEVLQTLQSVQSNNLAISACDNMADKNDSSEKKCDSQDNEQLQNVKNDSKECCREVICESEHKDGFESEITDNIESLKNIIEPSVSSSFDKLETICNFLDSADNPSELGISTACTGKPLENEQCHANPNSKGDNSFESEEFNLQLSENKEDNNENSNIDESISVPKILSMDLESQNREEKSHMTISSNENQITDAGPTEENVGISITGDLIDEAVSEPSLDIPEKESILKALGLQSLKAAEQAKHKPKEKIPNKSDNYTGTLKTVIKLNRDKKKGGRISSTIKMTVQHSKHKVDTEDTLDTVENTCRELKDNISKQETATSSDTAGAHRKSHYSNRSNMDGSSDHTSDGEGTNQDGTIKALVIPEKASSFSIHPGRLCQDECSYCFGKFGLFDTPCHIAQMKSVERQDKILATEKHLTRDSCLCDACYRHVDRKSNSPSYMNKSLKRNSLVAPGPKENHCHVLGCNKLSTNILRRKWIIKMKKNICQVINIDLDNPGLHSIPICDDHYSALEHLMVCSMCKRRLARNHIHYLGPEANELNSALISEGIPITLTDKPVVCKLCKCFASIILKDTEERSENSINFFNEYKRRLLHFNDILPMDEEAAEEPISVPTKPEKIEATKKKKKIGRHMNDTDSQNSTENLEETGDTVSNTNDQTKSRSESPADEYNVVDYNTLIPAIAMDCGSDNESKKEPPKTQPVEIKKILRNDKGQDVVEISKVYKSNSNKSKSDIVVQKLGSNPSISVRQLFPGEEDLSLDVHIDFNNVKDHTPEGWEKCTSIIQYDSETMRLWQELQKPYGNQSSFLRHLILLEKYFRNGDLVLSANASHHSINYSESVHNRLRAYDNISSSAKNVQPLSMIPFNKMTDKYSIDPVPYPNSSIGQSSSTTTSQRLNVTTSMVNRIPISTPNLTVTSQSLGHKLTKSNSALTITQLNNPALTSGSTVVQQIKPKMVGAPPGLISLLPGTNKPTAPLVKVPQSQKIKFPITKNWRPNLIPIDPNKKHERKSGLVQVISGGKPYHITLEDYKKMCAIKRSFEMKQKRLQEVQNAKPILVTHNSVLKSITPRKGLIISKTTPANVTVKTEKPVPSTESNGENENILEKLDKQVEKLESKLNERSALLLPRIPKSLTVIPQNVPKSSRPSSPILEITPKPSSKS